MEEYTKKTIDVILYNLVYFDYHNKNLTKEQSYILQDIKENLEKLKNELEKTK